MRPVRASQMPASAATPIRTTPKVNNAAAHAPSVNAERMLSGGSKYPSAVKTRAMARPSDPRIADDQNSFMKEPPVPYHTTSTPLHQVFIARQFCATPLFALQ